MTQTKRHIRPKISGPAKTFFGQKKWSDRPYADDGLVLTVEALPEEGMRGGGGYLFLCSLKQIGLFPCSPKIENLLSYVPCSPILSLFPSKLAFVPLKLMSFFLYSPKLPGGPHCYNLCLDENYNFQRFQLHIFIHMSSLSRNPGPTPD